jgi:hypothetical protein
LADRKSVKKDVFNSRIVVVDLIIGIQSDGGNFDFLGGWPVNPSRFFYRWNFSAYLPKFNRWPGHYYLDEVLAFTTIVTHCSI